MARDSFKDKLERRQISLIEEKTIFDGARGGGVFKKQTYSHILEKGSEDKNLFSDIRERVKCYFNNNKISFWGGKTVTPNTLSSQVSCLNHLFLIRDKHDAVKDVMQRFVGDKMIISKMCKVETKKETFNCEYIAFEMISNEDRMSEEKLTRGNTCTSIDALAVAEDSNGQRHVLVIEWKLLEDDSGNKAPTKQTSTNKEEIRRGKTRVERYGKLIKECSSLKELDVCDKKDGFYNSSLFTLPFYELMRQTLWADINKVDFDAYGYLHIHVIPEGNPMRNKKYKCIKDVKCNGVEEGWRYHLTEEGNDRYILADPHDVIDALEKFEQYEKLVKYLKRRYYFDNTEY